MDGQQLHLSAGTLFLLGLLILMPAGRVHAQAAVVPDSLKKEVPLVTVDSRPSGAVVRLKGAYSFVGRTPFKVPYPLNGRYDVKATKAGYESESSEVDFVQNEKSSLLIKLSAKTRLKAAYRSLIFPGWGQMYSGQTLRGAVISAAQIAFVVRTLLAMNEYNDSRNELDRAVEVFNSNLDETSFQDVQDKQLEAENDYDFRNTMLMITAGFWALNILDSIFFFPDRGNDIEIRPKTAFLGNRNNSALMITWKVGL